MNVEDGTCNIQSDKTLKLRNLGTMLGFDKTATIVANTLTKSPSTVNINRGLYYISICCDAVDRTKNFDNEGKKSCMITSLPITTNETLKGSASHFENIDSRVSINKGQYNSLNFTVLANNDVKPIGSILLELYITQNINERRRICY